MHPLVSPLYANLAGLPPLLIHVGVDELMLDDSTRLAVRARQAGVEVTLEVWEGMMHVFQMYAGMRTYYPKPGGLSRRLASSYARM
jgi:acetyl esterase/lipase